MNTRLLLLAALLLVAIQSFGQKDPKWADAVTDTDNLIVNGDFEDVDMKHLKNFGQLRELCPPWLSPTQAEPDLFYEGVKSEKTGVPSNSYGNQSPYSGSGYAGFRAYTRDLKLSRTYLQAELTKKLEKDHLYCIQMRISLADLSKNAVNNIGIFLSDRKIAQSNSGLMSLKPQVMMKNNAVVNTLDGWETICSTYAATGLEEFIIIGCFGTDDQLKITKVKKPSSVSGTQVNHAYYYIDAIEIVEVEAQSQCFCGTPEEREPDVLYSRATGITEDMKPAEIIPKTEVFFPFLSTEINFLFEADLNRLAGILKSNPNLSLEIIGHSGTPEIQEARVNARYAGIALDRAKAVKQWLVEQGIAENRLTTSSKDDSMPASTTPTPLGRAQNRRVQFVTR